MKTWEACSRRRPLPTVLLFRPFGIWLGIPRARFAELQWATSSRSQLCWRESQSRLNSCPNGLFLCQTVCSASLYQVWSKQESFSSALSRDHFYSHQWEDFQWSCLKCLRVLHLLFWFPFRCHRQACHSLFSSPWHCLFRITVGLP